MDAASPAASGKAATAVTTAGCAAPIGMRRVCLKAHGSPFTPSAQTTAPSSPATLFRRGGERTVVRNAPA